MNDSQYSHTIKSGAVLSKHDGGDGALPHWFVMRDLKRRNASLPAYKMLAELGIKVFTPMVWKLVERQGRRIPQEIPFMQDLLFVYSSREALDPIVARTKTLQYRFVRGGYQVPMKVNDEDMERFITAVSASENPYYYTPEEITPNMLGRRVRIVGGTLNGYEGRLLKLQGSRTKRIFVELPEFLTAVVEVQPEFIQLLKS